MEDRIIKFIAALRACGVRVSMAESADAFRAVDKVHRAADRRDTFGPHAPVGKVAVLRDLKRAKHTKVDMPAADHDKTVGVVKIRRTRHRRDLALARVDQFRVALACARVS